MTYGSIVEARFLARPNRFIAQVEVDGSQQIAHVKNTGRCRELLLPGATVFLERHNDPKRKTQLSLVAVYKGERLINMDSQAPNRVVEEALASGWRPPGMPQGYSQVRREFTHGDSRFDFALFRGGERALVEVKGVTLEENGVTRFPDAPTERGIKHLQGLVRAKAEGHGAFVVFVIQMGDVTGFAPNDSTHPAFGDALRQAAKAGVGICAFDCDVRPDGIALRDEVAVTL